MTNIKTCVKQEWFGDGVQSTATASSFLSILATVLAKKFFQPSTAVHLYEHFTERGGLFANGLFANTANIFNKIGNKNATMVDYEIVVHSVIDTVATFAKLVGGKNPIGFGFSIIWTVGELLFPIATCLLKDTQKEEPNIQPAESVKSPLVIDIDANGIATYGVQKGVFFDIDSDGFAEKTAWINGKDAFLAIDRNGNGIIDNASELFGDSEIYANGFEALKALDSNGDGIIDTNDIAWEQLLLWQDAINDGVSQADELITATDAGIAYIELNYKNQQVTDENGNEHRQTATVHWQDGHTTVIEDIWFQHDNAKTIDLTPLDVSDEEWAELAELPYIDAFGNVHSLWVACNDEFFIKQSTYFQAA